MDPSLRWDDEVGTYEVNLTPMSAGWDDELFCESSLTLNGELTKAAPN
jgi:hypothetical protein